MTISGKRSTMVIGTSSAFRAKVLRSSFEDVFQDFVLLAPDIDEKVHRAEDPYELTALIARAKMDAVLEKLRATRSDICSGVGVTFDQVVVTVDDKVREKPSSIEENREFLLSYSGNSVRTIGAYVVHSLETGQTVVDHESSEVFFSKYDADVVERVIARGVSKNSAGGLVIEDEELQQYIQRVDGTLNGVRGMDPSIVASLLKKLGIAVC